jgi:tol-pal system protein YbgF
MVMKSAFAAAFLCLAAVSPSLAFSQIEGGQIQEVKAATDGAQIPLPQVDVPLGEEILVAQDASGNVQMEEQIRLLNGKVEELTFQILQMQEQMRKLQEDNEFRFQEIEKSKQGNAGPKVKTGTDTAAAPVEDPVKPVEPGAVRVVTTDNSDSGDDVAATIDGAGDVGAPPKDLGSITFDENGNPVGAQAVEPGQVAAIPSSDNPGELYKTGYDHILGGDYPNAEAAFRTHIENYPADPQTADARYWLGESLIGQGRYRDAAEVLLKAQKEFPKAKKAPDMLLKLGVSLSALENKDVACATFAQVSKKYPKAAPALVERVAAEQAKAGC